MERWAWGIDIGATKIAIGCVDASGKVLQSIQIPTQAHQGPEFVATQICHALKSIKHPNSLPAGAGVAIAGQVDSGKGILLSGGNLGWSQVPFQAILESKLGVRVLLMNDVRAATYGEWLFGAGRNCKNFVCLFVGTGIGGGIVSNEKLLTGDRNSAGELGHLVVDMNGPSCTCRGNGCMEAIASGWAIARTAQEAILENPSLGAAIKAKATDGQITAKNVIEAYREGDPLASRIIEKAFKALAAGAVSIVNAFNPEKLIFGGGILEGLPELIEIIDQEVRQHALTSATEHLEIVAGSLGPHAPLIGVANVILRGHFGC